MKHTAKISLLIALALCLTVSGVYAAWAYTATTLNPVEGATADATIGLEAKVEGTQKIDSGTIKVTEGQTQLSITDNNGDKTGELTWNNDSNFSFYFQSANISAGNADGSVGSPTAINIKCTITLNYTGTNDVLKLVATDGWALSGNTLTKTFTNVGTTAQTFKLSDLVDFYAPVELPTEADYDAFATKMTNLAFSISINFAEA